MRHVPAIVRISFLAPLIVVAVLVFAGLGSKYARAQSIQIAAGASHSCILIDGAHAKCWGYNVAGQLGNNSAFDQPVPVNVVGLSGDLARIAAHGNHTCVLTTGGGIKCWGRNYTGELGVPASANSPAPVNVVGLESAVSMLALGGSHTCALTLAGGVKCWGYNASGQLGDGSNSNSANPVSVVGLSDGVVSVAGGVDHTCAVMRGGAVKCWGENGRGQLGNRSTTSSTVPVTVAGLSSGVSAVAAGRNHTCALTVEAGVKCWGTNYSGQLGNGTNIDSTAPVDVLGLSLGISGIAVAGGDHTCALTTSGGVKCWGNNREGNLGNNSVVDSSRPVNVSGLGTGVLSIATGGGHTCAVTTTHELKCWGYNGYGQLGNNSIIESHVPVTVIGLNSSIHSPSTVAMIEYYYAPLDYYFITSRASDKSLLDTAAGWTRTGKLFPTLANRDAGTSPITRFYFDQIAQSKSRGSHFYTLLPDEVAAVQALNPTNQPAPGKPVNEGVDSYAYLPSASGTCSSGQVRVYRLFRGNARFPDDPNHRFTTELSTYNSFVTAGWDGEGVKFCVPQ